MEQRKRGFGGGLVVGLLISVALLGVLVWLAFIAVTAGGYKLVREGQEPSSHTVSDSVLTEEENRKLSELLAHIDDEFLYETDRAELMEGVYHGLYDALGDPYSTYYSAKEYATVMEESDGTYVGIGVSVTEDPETGYIKVMKVFKDSPAQAAGLKPNDQLLGTDEADFYQMDINLAVTYIRGEEGTQVHLHWLRGLERMEADVDRRRIENETVTWEMLDGGIGYIYLGEFDTVTTGQMQRAMTELEEQGMKGLVLDVRTNPGGLVNVCTDICSLFLPKGVVTTIKDKYGNEQAYRIRDNEYSDIPMVLLVDGNSASASEILTGAMMDYGRCRVVGTKTFGKGIVQEVLQLSDGSGIRLTMADYFTPNGNNIHGVGITPDYVVEAEDGEEDVQMRKALEVLREEMNH